MHQSRRWRCGLLLVMLRLGNGDDTAGSSCVFNVAGVEYDLEPLIRDNECAARAKYTRPQACSCGPTCVRKRTHTQDSHVRKCPRLHAHTCAHACTLHPPAAARTPTHVRACTRVHSHTRTIGTDRPYVLPSTKGDHTFLVNVCQAPPQTKKAIQFSSCSQQTRKCGGAE